MARGERGKPARRTGTLGFRDKRCKLRGGAGEEDRPEANQIRREIAEAVERIVREPRVSRVSAPQGGAGEVFGQSRGSIDAIADLTEGMAHAEFQRTVRS